MKNEGGLMENVNNENDLIDLKGKNEDYFLKMVKLFSDFTAPQFVLSIPVWGWQNTGKTSSILSAGFFLDCMKNGVSLSVVNHLESLIELQEQNLWMKRAGIVETAKSSKLSYISGAKEIIEKNSWPPGTDSHIPYFFRIDKPNGPLGYLYIPDIPGGSFQEANQIASTVIADANAIIIIVDPEIYSNSNVLAKHYKDEIRNIIHYFANRNLPVAVFISKCDKYSSISDVIIDNVHQQLQIVRDAIKHSSIEIFRTSVIGSELEIPKSETQPIKEEKINSLPDSSHRQPDLLLKAWTWILYKAIRKVNENGLKHVVNIHPNINEMGKMNLSNITPDIREIGSISNRDSIPILCMQGNKSNFEILTIDSNRSVKKFSLKVNELNVSVSESLEYGIIHEFPENISEMRYQYINGYIIIGKRKEADSIWSGLLGEEIKKRSLEHPILSWDVIDQNSIITLNSNGKVSLLGMNTDDWISKKFISLFTNNSSVATIKYIRNLEIAYAIRGNECEAVKINENAFAERISISSQVPSDLSHVKVLNSNESIYIANDGKFRISQNDKIREFDNIIITNLVLVASSFDNSKIAIFSSDNYLRICYKDKNGIFQISENKHSIKLASHPDVLIWDHSGEHILCAFQEAQTWRVFKIYGV
ncbi:hypothetical protein [Leptospira noguchii]|uniref:hypothetical protein n=1 Tax=Leptospira noguchii TaxID=28182 RepID=UPI000773E276|nr:hypothetical protein [Leptospira noguchii]